MKMDILILGEVTQAWKDKHHMFSFICGANSEFLHFSMHRK